LLVGLAAAFGVASLTVGGPTLPSSLPRLPTLSDLDIFVRSPSRGQLAGGLAMLTWAVWLVWAYVLITTTLRVLVILGERFSDRAAWLCSFRTLSDLVTVGPIRKAVDASLAGALFVRVAVGAGAQELAVMPTFAQVQVYDVHPQSHASVRRVVEPIQAVHAPELKAGDVLYTVQPNDSLGKIAERFYGVWTSYTEIQEANLDREQPDGRTLANTSSVIYPGWRLVIPQPTQAVNTDADGQRWYTVRPGDNLTRISARLLGDGQRYRELFELNQGTDMGGGRVLTNPNLIWPGLHLRLPAIEEEEPPAPEPATEPVPEVAPAPPPPPSPTSRDESAVPTPSAASVQLSAPAAEATEVPTVAPAASTADSSPAVAPPWAQIQLPDLSAARASWPVPLGGALLGAGLLLAGGYLRRRRQPVSGFETAVEVTEGFAQALGGDEASYEEPITALAEQVLGNARERCPSLRLSGASAGRTKATLLFRVATEETGALEAAAAAFGAKPGAVRLTTLPAGTVRWDQNWATVRPQAVSGATDRPHVELFPIGLAGDRRVVYGERRGGPVLVAGVAPSGVYEVLSAFVVDRVRRRSPEDLVVITIARGDRLNSILADAPQQHACFIDPADTDAVTGALADIGEQLRMRLEASDPGQPELVLVVDEWTELPECGRTLDLLAHHGASVGMHLIAATTRVDDLQLKRSVGLFGTRLVLQVADEAASVRLLGQAGAEDLDHVGQAYPYLDGEVLPRVRAFRVPPLYVQELVTRMLAQLEPEGRSSIFAEVTDDGSEEPQNIAAASMRPAQGGPESDPRVAVPSPAQLLETPREALASEAVGGATAGDQVAEDLKASCQQLPLIRAVPIAKASGPSMTRPTPSITVDLFGSDRILVDGREPGSTRGVSWDLFRIVCGLPRGKATLVRVASLQYPSDDDQKAAIQRVRQNKSNLQKAWGAGVTKVDAECVLLLEDGVLLVNEELVTVDVQRFVQAMHEGNKARKDTRLEDAIAAYRRARALYTGPLLAGRDEDYEWLGVPVEGRLTLREAHRHQERVVTERLAELLVTAGRPAEAAALYAELMRDPGPPDAEADELDQFVHRQYAFREECARAVFECCRLAGDVPSLTRAYQELRSVLRALAADADVPASAEATEPGAVTQALYDSIYAELTRGAAAAGD